MKTWIILGGVAALATGTWWLWPSAGEQDRKSAVKLAKVERGDLLLTVQATGDIKPVKEVELKSKASGRVERFKKQPGDLVEADELIVELDKRTEQRSLSLQEANLATAEANLQLTRLKYDADLQTTESEAVGYQEDADQKKAELRRLEKLSGDLITESELSGVRLAARLSEEKVKQVQTALTLIKNRKEADEKLAIADVQKARVAVEDARERLRDTEIRAPLKGILLKKLVEEGQIVASGISATAGGTAIAVVADISRMIVEANVDETDIVKVKKGHTAAISLSSGDQEKLNGVVELLLPRGEIDSNVIVFKVRVAMDGDVFGRVYPGMTATVEIRVDERKGVLLVPSEAVRIEKSGAVVYVPGGKPPTAKPVKIGLDNGVFAEVLSGLEEKAEVIVTQAAPLENSGDGRPRIRF